MKWSTTISPWHRWQIITKFPPLVDWRLIAMSIPSNPPPGLHGLGQSPSQEKPESQGGNTCNEKGDRLSCPRLTEVSYRACWERASGIESVCFDVQPSHRTEVLSRSSHVLFP